MEESVVHAQREKRHQFEGHSFRRRTQEKCLYKAQHLAGKLLVTKLNRKEWLVVLKIRHNYARKERRAYGKKNVVIIGCYVINDETIWSVDML